MLPFTIGIASAQQSDPHQQEPSHFFSPSGGIIQGITGNNLPTNRRDHTGH
jgi:hypothetical protein